MLKGRFGAAGRPFVTGRLTIPRLRVVADVSFLVDTGADQSLVAPADGIHLQLDYSQLGRVSRSVGTAGFAESYTERASVAFTDPRGSVFVYHLDLEIAVPSDEIVDMPSLLGREVLDRWRMVYDPGRGKLTFTVRSADVTIPLTR